MLAQLGAVVFQTVGPLVGVQSRREFPWTEHATIEGKPLLEAAGEALESLTLDLSLVAALGDVAAQLAELRAMGERREPVPLLWGSGEYRGRFVLAELDEVLRQTDAAGVVLACTVRVSLKESADRAPAETVRAEPVAVRSRQGGRVQRAQPARPPAGNPRAVPAATVTRQRR